MFGHRGRAHDQRHGSACAPRSPPDGETLAMSIKSVVNPAVLPTERNTSVAPRCPEPTGVDVDALEETLPIT